MHHDFLKYGIDNFTFQVLEQCSIKDLDGKEKYYIKKYDTYVNGYNLTQGGGGNHDYIKEHLYVCNCNRKAEECFKIKWEDYTKAARELSPSALNLFMYLAKNQDGYSFYFSSKDYCNTFNVVDKTCRNAKNELVSKGYLKEGDNNNVYFDCAGGYLETSEDLRQKARRIDGLLKELDEKSYDEFRMALAEAKLKDISDEKLYKLKLKNVIRYGRDLIAEISTSELENLL